MNHRERVEAAPNHEEPDRCPMHVGFTPEFAARILRDLGWPEFGALAEPYALQRRLDHDMLLTGVGWSGSSYALERLSRDGISYTDEWGVGWRRVRYDTRFGPGYYTEIVGHPLADDAAIASYQAPDPHRPGLYTGAEQLIDGNHDEYWIVGSTACTVFETAWALRGLDVLNPIQPKSMGPADVKRRIGDRLCFWRPIDEQETLPFGTADDVRAEVILRLHTFGRSGGLIIGPTHSVQLDTPLVNFWAMVNTIAGTPYSAL